MCKAGFESDPQLLKVALVRKWRGEEELERLIEAIRKQAVQKRQ